MISLFYRRHSVSNTGITASPETNHVHPRPQRVLLFVLRSPNDQIQVIAVPPCRLDDCTAPGFRPSVCCNNPGRSKERDSLTIDTLVYLERLSVGLSLTSLALGFFTIAALSFANASQADAGNTLELSAVFCNASIASSLLAGGIFTVGAYLYWRRLLNRKYYGVFKPAKEGLQVSPAREFHQNAQY